MIARSSRRSLRRLFLTVLLACSPESVATAVGRPCVVREARNEHDGEGIHDVYVSPEGDDRNTGTLCRPVRTVERARDLVRPTIAAGMTGDVTIHLRGGKYYLAEPIRFDQRDSGNNGFRVILRSSRRERAVLIGGQRVTGWRSFSDDIYRADVSEIGDGVVHALYENGARVTKARTPNSGYYRTVSGGAHYLEYGPGELPTYFPLEDASILIWTGPQGDIQDVNTNLLRVTQHAPAYRALLWTDPMFAKARPDQRYYVQGALDFLDAPGEFHMESATGTLYYWPRALPIEEQEIVAPASRHIIELVGESDSSRIENFTLERLTFTATDTFTHGYSGGFMLFRPESGAIFVANARNLEVLSSRVTQVAGDGIFLAGYSQDNRVYGNLIEETGGRGVVLWGNSICGPDTHKSNVVENNLIRGIGRSFASAGILLFFSGNNRIQHNKIHDISRHGIWLRDLLNYDSLFWVCDGVPLTWENHYYYTHTRNNVIAFNDVFDAPQEAEDSGGIDLQACGWGNLLDNNLVHDISGPPGHLVHGIYVDTSADGTILRNNIIYRIQGETAYPLVLKGLHSIIDNNIIANNDATAHIKTRRMKGHATSTVRRNIFCASNDEVPEHIYEHCGNWNVPRITLSDENLFHHLSGSYTVRLQDRVWTLAQWQSVFGHDLHSITADPLFVDPEADDYTVGVGSPALTLGFVNIDTSTVGLLPDFPWRACDQDHGTRPWDRWHWVWRHLRPGWRKPWRGRRSGPAPDDFDLVRDCQCRLAWARPRRHGSSR